MTTDMPTRRSRPKKPQARFPAPQISHTETRLDELRIKRRKASDFAHELAAMESRARDWQERESLAARRRDVEWQAATFEHLIAELESEAAV